jgi:hypothetical protein
MSAPLRERDFTSNINGFRQLPRTPKSGGKRLHSAGSGGARARLSLGFVIALKTRFWLPIPFGVAARGARAATRAE